MGNAISSALLVSAIGTVAAVTAARGVELNGLEFAVTTEKTAYRVGEPIRLTVTWTNAGRGKLNIPAWRGPINGPATLVEENETIYEFAVYFEGKEWVDFRGGPTCPVLVGLDLESQKSVTRSYDISDVYSFARPGRYVLRAVQFGWSPDDKLVTHWRGRIVHPDVEIRIQE